MKLKIENDPLETLATEFIERIRSGSHAEIKEYEVRYPEMAGDIATLFPTIASMEKTRRERLSDTGTRRLNSVACPERLGDFRIIKELGRGGMGIVYLAFQESLERHVALKVLPGQSLKDCKHIMRFEREFKTAGSLHHSNIVPVHSVGLESGFHYYSMQYIDGISIDTLLKNLSRDGANKGVLPDIVKRLVDGSIWEESSVSVPHEKANDRDDNPSPLAKERAFFHGVARIGQQAANALQYAHRQGILHRDIKPGNLLIDSRGTVWISDFGLARALYKDDISNSGDVFGTVRYMAPEQISGAIDCRSDIYSLGLTMYEMLAIRPAFDSNQSRSRLQNPQSIELPISLRGSNPRIPRDLETIVFKSLSVDPSHRYQTAAELADELTRFLEDRPIKARPVSAGERLYRWSSRNPVVASLASVSLLLLISIAVVSTWSYLRETKMRREIESLSEVSTGILDQIYNELAPRSLSSEQPLASINEPRFANATIENIPSKQTIAVLENLLRYYDKIASETHPEPTVILKAADANHRVGNIQRLLGNFSAAEISFRRVIELCGALRSSGGSADAELLLAVSLNDLGQTFDASGQSKKARDAYYSSLSILERLSAQGESQDVQFEYAKSLYLLDRYGYHQATDSSSDFGGDEPGALSRQAAEILEELVEHNPNPEFSLLLARCYRRLSNYDPLGLPNTSDDKAQRVLEKLISDYPDNSNYRFELGFTLNSCRMENFTNDNPETVISRLEDAETIASDLVESFPDIPHYLELQVATKRQSSLVFYRLGRWDESLSSALNAVELQRLHVKRFSNSGTVQNLLLAKLRLELAELVSRKNDHEKVVVILRSLGDDLDFVLKSHSTNHRADELTDVFGRVDKLLLALEDAGHGQESVQLRAIFDHRRSNFSLEQPQHCWRVSQCRR